MDEQFPDVSVTHSEFARDQLELVGQRDVADAGIVGVEGDAQLFIEKFPDRMLLRRLDTARLQIAREADLEHGAMVGTRIAPSRCR